MNSPFVTKNSREQLLERLSSRRPLYEAIKENLPKNKALYSEMLEPRVLLSADLVAVADALNDGVSAAGEVIDEFFDTTLLDQDLPLLVFPANEAAGIDAGPAPINDLMSIDINLDGSYTDSETEGTLNVRDAGEESTIAGPDELTLDGYDTDNDKRVSLKEFFNGAFINPLEAKLTAIAGGE